MMQGLPYLAYECLKSTTEEVSQFYEKLQFRETLELGPLEKKFGIFKLGGVVVKSLTNVEFNALATFLGNAPETEIVK